MLLDEVTANLDPATEVALVESLKGVKAAKVFITHSERLLDQVDRVFRIENGRLTEDPRPPAQPGRRRRRRRERQADACLARSTVPRPPIVVGDRRDRSSGLGKAEFRSAAATGYTSFENHHRVAAEQPTDFPFDRSAPCPSPELAAS